MKIISGVSIQLSNYNNEYNIYCKVSQRKNVDNKRLSQFYL